MTRVWFVSVLGLRTGPLSLPLLLILNVVLGFEPLVTLWLARHVIDSVVSCLSGHAPPDAWQGLLLFVVAQCVVRLLASSARHLGDHVAERLSRKVDVRLQQDVKRHCTELDLAFFESAESQNVLSRTGGHSVSAATGMLSTLLGLFQANVTIIAALAALFSFSPWVCLAACCVAVPSCCLNARLSRERYGLAKARSERLRRSGYLAGLLVAPQQVRENLLFGLGQHFLEMWHRNAAKSLAEDLRMGARQTWFRFSISALGLAASALSYVAIVWLVLQRGGTVGIVTMYAGLFANAEGQVMGLSFNVANLHSDAMFLEDYFTLMAAEPIVEGDTNGEHLEGPIGSIEFDDVSFAYPGTCRPVLTSVSLEVQRGERVFLAGRNGTGKTTLLKLLLRLYDPSSGRILVNGRDIREYSVSSLRRAFAVLMQDYTRYLLTARENVIVGDLAKREDTDAMNSALAASGFAETLEKLPDGMDSVLGRIFGGETELPTGEWQRLALARAFFRDASVYVLDEPTGALDVQSEAEVLTSFKQRVEGKIAFIVSHRLAASSVATRIIFMEDGHIAEDGTHRELMARGGPYASLFRMQQMRYGLREKVSAPLSK